MFLNRSYTQALRFVCTTKCWKSENCLILLIKFVWLCLTLVSYFSPFLNIEFVFLRYFLSFSFLFLSFFVIYRTFSPFLSHFHFDIIFFSNLKISILVKTKTQLIQLSIFLCIIQSSFRTVGRCSRRIDAIDQNKLFAVYGCSVDMCIACERWKIGCCCSATV